MEYAKVTDKQATIYDARGFDRWNETFPSES